MQAAGHRFDHYVLLPIFHPPCEPCASPPTVPPQPPSTTSVPTTRPVPCVARRSAYRGCPAAPHPVRGDDMSAAVTTYRHRLPGRAVEPPSAQPVTCRAGRDLTPHGGRASGRGERWHEKCLLKDLTAPFYGANRAGAPVSQGLRDAFWRQGRQAGFKAVLDGNKAFSETDCTGDLKKMEVPTLIMHGDEDQIVPIGASAMLSSKLVKGADRKFKRLFHAVPPAPPALAGPAASQARAGRRAPRPPRGLQPSGTRGRRSGGHRCWGGMTIAAMALASIAASKSWFACIGAPNATVAEEVWASVPSHGSSRSMPTSCCSGWWRLLSSSRLLRAISCV